MRKCDLAGKIEFNYWTVGLSLLGGDEDCIGSSNKLYGSWLTQQIEKNNKHGEATTQIIE